MNRLAAVFTSAQSIMAKAQMSGATQSVTGELIDIGNYSAGHSRAEYAGTHGRACALEGFEVGLLASDGKVYHVAGELAANSNAKLVPHMMAKAVTITGAVSVKDGQTFITGSDIKAAGK